MPPPGLNLPPPPGVAPAAPPQPQLPNAADDPFGAMNAMAAVGTVQRAPEIVIVNDGKPVESVGSSSMGATIAKVAVPAVIALVVGVAIGKIGTGASHYNDGIAGARALLDNAKQYKKTLSELDGILDEMNTKNKYKPDSARDKDLAAIAAKLEVKTNVYTLARNITTDQDLAGMTLAYYAGLTEIRALLDVHNKSARTDAQGYTVAKKAGDAAKLGDNDNAYLSGSLRYAAVISAPANCGEDKDRRDCNAPFGVQLVEVGPPLCGGKVSMSGKCSDGESPSGYGFRTDPGAPSWSSGEIVTSGTDNVPTKKIVPLVSNNVLDTFLKSNEAGASELLYTRRLRTLAERTKKLIDDANKLEARLQTEQSKGTRFTFFM